MDMSYLKHIDTTVQIITVIDKAAMLSGDSGNPITVLTGDSFPRLFKFITK